MNQSKKDFPTMNSSYNGGSRLREMPGMARADECVQDHPVSSSMVVFGLGIGLGVLLVNAMHSPRRSRYEEVSDRGRHLASQVVAAVREAVPDMVRRQMSSFR